jgi:hypothetical protein
MSRTDDRIRGELKGLARPVPLEGVVAEVARRKERRRFVRRAQMAALTVVVLAGSAAGVYSLVRLWDRSDATRPGDESDVSVPTPRKTFTPSGAECDATALDADINGDGVLDEVIVYWPSETTCDPVTERQRYQARVVLSSGTREAVPLEPQQLPECETPFMACKAFGAPDVDGNGSAEVAIAIAPGGPAAFYGVYVFDADRRAGDPALVRYSVDPPGDPWHDKYGFPPGPAVLMVYGSVTHQHWGACFEEEGDHFLAAATALRTAEDPDLYDVHTTVFRVDGAALEVVMQEQGRVPTDRLEATDELCGSRLFVRG